MTESTPEMWARESGDYQCSCGCVFVVPDEDMTEFLCKVDRSKFNSPADFISHHQLCCDNPEYEEIADGLGLF
jgi:hypothetical protein